MTVDEALRLAAKRLSSCSSSPRLDAEVLLSHVATMGRAALLARYGDQLTSEQLVAFLAAVERRSEGEPVAYITGHKEFYGLDLLMTRDVLVPRPETESVVDACLELLPSGEQSQLADVGTGSGAIVVAVCKHRPLARAFATDVSPEALEVARLNCQRHGVAGQVTLLAGDLLEPLPNPVNVVAANLPYVSPGEAEPDVAAWEPKVAVFGGGEDGTALIHRFLSDAPAYLLPGGALVMEVAYSQGPTVAALAHQSFPSAEVEVRKDLAGYDRIVVIRT